MVKATFTHFVLLTLKSGTALVLIVLTFPPLSKDIEAKPLNFHELDTSRLTWMETTFSCTVLISLHQQNDRFLVQYVKTYWSINWILTIYLVLYVFLLIHEIMAGQDLDSHQALVDVTL